MLLYTENILSVESTVLGMLSENSNYVFNPLELPPGISVEGQAVFIISNVEDGATFTDALRTASQAQLELFNVEGVLLDNLTVL